MSRAYRIRVSETLRKIIRAEDGVSTQLEILNVLPAEEMCELLIQELQRRGFQRRETQWVRVQDDIEIAVDPKQGTVAVQAARCQEIELEGEREDFSFDRDKERAATVSKRKLKSELKSQADEKEAVLQNELTEKLESQLMDLRKELDQIANRVTAGALKKKAARMGKIKQISEDAASGSMTIVLEV